MRVEKRAGYAAWAHCRVTPWGRMCGLDCPKRGIASSSAPGRVGGCWSDSLRPFSRPVPLHSRPNPGLSRSSVIALTLQCHGRVRETAPAFLCRKYSNVFHGETNSQVTGLRYASRCTLPPCQAVRFDVRHRAACFNIASANGAAAARARSWASALS